MFITAKTWKQQKSPSVSEWINKLWYINTKEYYLVIRRNELSSHKKIWRNLKGILLSKRSQSGYVLDDSNYMTFWKSKTMETVKRSVVVRGSGRRGRDK